MEFKEIMIEKYPKQGAAIVRHFETGVGKPAIWENITRVNLNIFVRYLKNTVTQNSARTYAAMVKSVLNNYRDEIELPAKFENVLRVKDVKCINAFLDEDDIKKFASYEAKSKRERYVKNIFLIGCLTGARHSDAITFTTGNILGSRLSYVSEKTKTLTFVPLSPMVARLIEELPKTEPVNEANFNIAVRKICKKVGIREKIKVFRTGRYIEAEKWKFISSHTARRSFATNLCLRDADLYSISKMMGHSDIKMTENYICCGLQEQSEYTMRYFNNFK